MFNNKMAMRYDADARAAPRALRAARDARRAAARRRARDKKKMMTRAARRAHGARGGGARARGAPRCSWRHRASTISGACVCVRVKTMTAATRRAHDTRGGDDAVRVRGGGEKAYDAAYDARL